MLARSAARAGPMPAAAVLVPSTWPTRSRWRAAFALVREGAGSVDVLVNSAGVHRGGSSSRSATPLERGARHQPDGRVHRGPGRASAARGGLLDRQHRGGGRPAGFAGDVAYGSAKAGLSGLTQTLAMEFARDGVRLNLVVPGFVETDMTDGTRPPRRWRILAGIPAGRPARAEEIADVVWSVAGSTYMTGAVAPVDGGLMATFGGSG